MKDLPDLVTLLKRVIPKAQRNIILKGTPCIVFQTDNEVVWLLEGGEIVVCYWDGEGWPVADDALALQTLKTALFEYVIKSNFDLIVRGITGDEQDKT